MTKVAEAITGERKGKGGGREREGGRKKRSKKKKEDRALPERP